MLCWGVLSSCARVRIVAARRRLGGVAADDDGRGAMLWVLGRTRVVEPLGLRRLLAQRDFTGADGGSFTS